MRSTIMTSAPGSPALLRQSIENDGLSISYFATARRGILTPPTLVGNPNNYSPTGLVSASGLRLTTGGGGGARITGLDISAWPVGERDGIELDVWNISLNALDEINLAHLNAGSAGENQFITPSLIADFVVAPGGGVRLFYDLASQRWRIKVAA